MSRSHDDKVLLKSRCGSVDGGTCTVSAPHEGSFWDRFLAGGLVSVTNDGTAPAYPKIVFARSGGTLATIKTLRNETTGKEILFDYDLSDGETLTIDLAPLQKSAISSTFGRRLDAVLGSSSFGSWLLQPDSNDVTAFVDVTGGPTVTAYMVWKDVYKSFD